MKNMKVATKLIVSFLIVAIFAAAVGVSGIVGLTQMDAKTDAIYNQQMTPLKDLSKLTTLLQCMRVGMREYTIAVASNDADTIEATRATIADIHTAMAGHFDAYAPTITSSEAIGLFNEARTLFEGSFITYLQRSYDYAKAGDLGGCLRILAESQADIDTIVTNLDRCMDIRMEVAGTFYATSSALATILLIVIISILVFAVAIATFFAFYISGLISKPLKPLTAFMVKASSTGNIQISAEDAELIRSMAQIKDEIGQCITATATFIGHITEIGKKLEAVAEGDLTHEVKLLSEHDTMGLSLQKMLGNLNDMFGEIHSSTAQVAVGSKQIADGAQALAQGSTEQAATVVELSTSISEISGKTRSNAEMAGQAAQLAGTIMLNAEKGNRQMDEMMEAVKEINQASQSISKVIKVIDDIAFQTNILALNAAVEAARAGQHGKGFAVVAEEVRNLAAKSAEAAKDTGGLIANSMDKAELGARIAGETAESLAEIVAGISESNKIIGEIARSSEEQSLGIDQINNGIDQVSQVVQQNSATAEESAAAAEELNGQSEMLEQLISRFKLNGKTHIAPKRPQFSPKEASFSLTAKY